MSQIGKISQKTHNRFLNFYEVEAIHRDGRASTYYVSSRAKDASELKAVTGVNRADGVIMYGVWGEDRSKVVLIRQYRFPLGGYIYEFPAGLVEPGEDMTDAAVREMFERPARADVAHVADRHVLRRGHRNDIARRVKAAPDDRRNSRQSVRLDADRDRLLRVGRLGRIAQDDAATAARSAEGLSVARPVRATAARSVNELLPCDIGHEALAALRGGARSTRAAAT